MKKIFFTLSLLTLSPLSQLFDQPVYDFRLVGVGVVPGVFDPFQGNSGVLMPRLVVSNARPRLVLFASNGGAPPVELHRHIGMFFLFFIFSGGPFQSTPALFPVPPLRS